MNRRYDDLITAATHIGRELCASAYWFRGRCNWVGRSPREAAEPGAPITPTAAALGPDVYAGTAGVALFLAELFERTGEEEFRTTARGAIRQALWKSDDRRLQLNNGFYSGRVGIAFAAARVGSLTDDDRLTNAAGRLASRTASRWAPDEKLDVVSGSAGAVAPLLQLANLPGGGTLEGLTTVLAVELAASATKRDGKWSWDNDRASGDGFGSTPLCGMAHGASGMGLALIEVGSRFHRDDLIEGGIAAFAYEDDLYDVDQGNWPDLREHPWASDRKPARAQNPSMTAWCHGAAGIGLARLRALQLLPEHSSVLRLGVDRAIAAAESRFAMLPLDVDASPCHGRAGVAETLLYASEVLGDPSHAQGAVEMWHRVLDQRDADEPWPSGVASGRNNPSLMLGTAGVGYALLRAASPKSTPSVLVLAGGVERTTL